MREKGQPIVSRGKSTLALVIVAGSLLAYGYHWRVQTAESAANYQLVYKMPNGWQPMPVTPGMMFVYKNKATQVSMRGAVNNMICDVNPTPDMDAEAIMSQYVSVTKDNLKGWHYARLDPVKANGVEFQLIRRWTADRCVVSAVGVRGNTTVIIALVGDHQNVPHVDQGMPDFRNYLANLTLRPYHYAMD
jgi:hypothetical protein